MKQNKTKGALFLSITAALMGTSSASTLAEYLFDGTNLGAPSSSSFGTTTNLSYGFTTAFGGDHGFSGFTSSGFVRSEATDGIDPSLASAITNDAYLQFTYTAGSDDVTLDSLTWTHFAIDTNAAVTETSNVYLTSQSTGFTDGDELGFSTITGIDSAAGSVSLGGAVIASGTSETFRFYIGDNQDNNSWITRINDITLTGSIPEPSSTALLGLSGISILLRRKR